MNKPVKLDLLDVVSVPETKRLIDASTFKVIEMSVRLARMSEHLRKGLFGEFNDQLLKEWSDTGVECEVLKMDGRSWQKGKVRISLEFIPDEEDEEILETNLEEESIANKLPGSRLDDLRTQLKIINEGNI